MCPIYADDLQLRCFLVDNPIIEVLASANPAISSLDGAASRSIVSPLYPPCYHFKVFYDYLASKMKLTLELN